MTTPAPPFESVALGYVVHILIDMDGERSDEMTQEFATYAEAVEAVATVPNLTTWRAVTIYRAEDFPRMMQDAVQTERAPS